MIFGHKLFETIIILSAKFYHSFFHMMLFYVVVSNACLCSPRNLKKWTNFDVRIFFRWVETQPPTSPSPPPGRSRNSERSWLPPRQTMGTSRCMDHHPLIGIGEVGLETEIASQGKHQNSANIWEKPTKDGNSKVASPFFPWNVFHLCFFVAMMLKNGSWQRCSYIVSSMWFVDVMNCANHNLLISAPGTGRQE